MLSNDPSELKDNHHEQDLKLNERKKRTEIKA